MPKVEQLSGVKFGHYEITGPAGQVLARSRPLALSPKAVAVLWTLVRRAGEVVGKEELFAAVWPGTIVSEGVITNCVRELRRALRDVPATPRYIETVSRRGYRFLEKVISSQYSVVSRGEEHHKAKVAFLTRAPSTLHSTPTLVGREAELAQLHKLLAKALNGERQLVFVTGEAGIGKTALIETFLSEVRGPRSQAVSQKSEAASQVKNYRSRIPGLRPLDHLGAMHRALRRGGSVLAGAGGARALGSRGRGRGVDFHPAPVCPELASATARAALGSRRGGLAAARSRHDAGADATRDGGGAGDVQRPAAVDHNAGGLALERCLHD